MSKGVRKRTTIANLTERSETSWREAPEGVCINEYGLPHEGPWKKHYN